MSTDYQNKTIALAGLHQALTLIQDIAWKNTYSYPQIDASLLTLFVRDPDTYIEVYGNIDQVKPGLIALQTSFKDKQDKAALERARYMVGLMILSKKVLYNSSLSEQIGTTLNLLEEAADDLENQRNYVIERLAQLYKNTISKLNPRIIIYGKPEILNDSDNAAYIRALLLAGLRSAILWYQAGGTQFNLLLGKSKYLRTIDQMLA